MDYMLARRTCDLMSYLAYGVDVGLARGQHNLPMRLAPDTMVPNLNPITRRSVDNGRVLLRPPKSHAKSPRRQTRGKQDPDLASTRRLPRICLPAEQDGEPDLVSECH